MGTRADFYVGIGKNAEWLGSVAWDGYQWDENIDNPISTAKSENDFRKAVSKMLSERKDGTTPEMGWPWPWEDSNLTDYVYSFHDGKVDTITEKTEWPNMESIQNVNYGSRSGIIIVGE